jgi:hypothetical protein
VAINPVLLNGTKPKHHHFGGMDGDEKAEEIFLKYWETL